jgi:hypothetical protein
MRSCGASTETQGIIAEGNETIRRAQINQQAQIKSDDACGLG